MENALICIAKNEDHYIDEWIQYHLKLGFDKIFLYQNNWRYSGKHINNPQIELIDYDGYAKQNLAYNDFIDNRRLGFDFAAFFDCDEFLRLPPSISLYDFLNGFSDCYGIGINWRLFGDAGLRFDGNEYSVLKRFTKCQTVLNRHIKTVLNVRKTGNLAHFICPHCVDASFNYNFISDASHQSYIHGPWNDCPAYNGIQLNHYFCKTIDEYEAIKIPRGKADTQPDHSQYFRKIDEFNKHNFNDIEDLTARDFYLNDTVA